MVHNILLFFCSLSLVGMFLVSYVVLSYVAFIVVAIIAPVKFKVGDWLIVALAPLSVIGLAIYSLSSFKKQ
jgi:hypothetical protein